MPTSTTSPELQWHAQRAALINELHSRPFRRIGSGTSITHLALLSDDAIKGAQTEHLQRLSSELGADHSVSSDALNSFSIGSFDVRMERHLEFTSLTFTDGSATPLEQPFTRTALDRLPQGWLEGMPGTVVAAFHVRVDQGAEPISALLHRSRSGLSSTRKKKSPLRWLANIWICSMHTNP